MSTYPVGRIEEHKYQHHDVVRRPADDEHDHDHDRYPQGLHFGFMDQPLTVRVRAAVIGPIHRGRLYPEDLLATWKNAMIEKLKMFI